MPLLNKIGALSLVFSLLLSGGCTPTCEQTCKKLMRCDELATDGLDADRCEEYCRDEEDLFKQWDDTQLQEALDEEKRCIDEQTCEAIADGACYDERLYSY